VISELPTSYENDTMYIFGKQFL